MPGSINSGIKTNDAYTDGSFSIVAPVWSSIGSGSTLEGGLVYVQPYISWGEGGEVASSLGMGWRYLFSDQPVSALTDHDREHDKRQAGFFEEGWAIGASLFLDMLDTQSNQQFWQLGTGVELMSRYLELRGNYYIPLTGKKETGSFRTRETTTQSQTTQYSTTSLSDPTASGYTIGQDLVSTTYAQTTTRTTTIERLFRQYEEGLQGWDAELAVLVPWIDRWMDVKLIGGYYHFDNQPFGPQARGTGKVEGWKAGVEVRPVPALALSASWYQDEKLAGSDWIAGIRIELPFETTNIGDGKGGFWGHIKDAFKPRRRHFAERLAEPVHRQNAAVKLGGVTEEKKNAAATTSSLHRVTRVISQTSTRIVLADDVVFVDNSIGSPTNPGTYEAPLDTIQGGENTANGLFGDNGKVFVQGGGPNYVENVVVDRSTAFYGSGKGVAGSNGQVFQGRNSISPVLVGSFAATGIGELLISGFDLRAKADWISDPFWTGIRATNVGKVTIIGNSISRVDAMDAATGISVLATGTKSLVTIQDNFIIGFSTIPGADTGYGIAIGSSATGSVSAKISGNYLSGNGTGISLSVDTGSALDVTVRRNTFANHSVSGVILSGIGAQLTIEDNLFIQEIPGSYGIFIYGAFFVGGRPSISGSLSNTFLNPGGFTWRYGTGGSVSGSLVIDGVVHDANQNLK